MTAKTLKILLPALIATTSLAAAWALMAEKTRGHPEKPERELPVAETLVARPETLRLNVKTQGVVSARSEIDLVAEVSGKVVQVHPAFAAGGFFEAGDTLVTIDPRDYDFAVTRMQAKVAEAQREFLREEAEAEQAEQEWQALGSGEPSDYALHRPHLREWRAKLAAAKADLAEARLRRARCELKAPFDGRIRHKQVDVGQYVEAGRALGRLYSIDVAEVRLPVPADQMEFLDLPLSDPDGGRNPAEEPAVVLTARLGNRVHRWQGRIVRTEAAMDSDTGMLHVVAEVEKPYGFLGERPPLVVGQFVLAEIEGRERHDLVRIPAQALRAGHQVYVVDDSERLRPRTVEVLRRDDEGVVVSGGIEAGERILVAGIELPVAGMRVTVTAARLAAGPAPDTREGG